MTWAGPLALLLVLAGSWIELDREGTFVEIAHFDEAASLNDQMLEDHDWGKLEVTSQHYDNLCLNNVTTTHSDIYSEYGQSQTIPEEDVSFAGRGASQVVQNMEPVNGSNDVCPLKARLNVTDKNEMIQLYGTEIADSEENDNPFGLFQQSTGGIERDFVMKDFECEYNLDMNVGPSEDDSKCELDCVPVLINGTLEDACVQGYSPDWNDGPTKGDFEYQYNYEFNDQQSGNSVMLYQIPESKWEDNAVEPKTIDAQFENDPEFDYINFDFSHEPDASKSAFQGDEVSIDESNEDNFVNGDELPQVHNLADDDVEIGLSVSSIIYDHFIEPAQQWWQDKWLKYLRKYIRDTKWLMTSVASSLKVMVEKAWLCPSKILYAVYDSLAYYYELECDLCDKLIFLIEDVGLSVSTMYDLIGKIISEMYMAAGNIRLSIRGFMHDKEYRFNYFWYVFYTTLNCLSSVMFFQTSKKCVHYLYITVHLVVGFLVKMVKRKKLVNVSIGTEPRDALMVSVKVDVLRGLIQNRETEVERLEEIKQLEDDLDHARAMTSWSVGKNGVLEEQLERLRAHSEEAVNGAGVVGAEALNDGGEEADVHTEPGASDSAKVEDFEV